MKNKYIHTSLEGGGKFFYLFPFNFSWDSFENKILGICSANASHYLFKIMEVQKDFF